MFGESSERTEGHSDEKGLGMEENLNVREEKVVRWIGQRGFLTVMVITAIAAVAGPLAEESLGGRWIVLLWIPLCFFIVPTIHHLAKKVIVLEDRVSRMEQKA
jgi:hypothetical protein